MTEPATEKQPLREVLNLRLDEPLAREIERIAGVLGASESEAARKLLQYGIDVQRKLEADDLQRRYDYTTGDDYYRYAEVTAKWVEQHVDEDW